METLPELYDILAFFPIRDFMQIRLISSTFRESSKSYDRSICTNIPKHSRWRRIFPKAHLIQTNILIQEDQFIHYIHLEKLNLNHTPIIQENAFAQLPHLQVLEVWSSHWDQYRPRIQHVTSPMFRHLSQLHTLRLFSNHDVTDEALSYLPQLKRLLLDHCKQITSKGIQYLKQLTDLHLHTQSNITNEAFQGLPIQTLYINQNALVTDQGILSLQHLTKLTTFKTPHIRGDGYKAMPQLIMVYLNGVTISDYSDFKHVRSLILNHCILPNEDYEEWTSLRTIQIYNAYVCYPTALFKISLAPHLRQFTIEHCPSMAPYEEMLKTYFGEKLFCKHLQYLHPMY
jgi:hypothetical protein